MYKGEVTIPVPHKLENEYQAYEFFSKAYGIVADFTGEIIYFDFKNTTNVMGNLTAVMAALIESIKRRNKKVTFKNVSSHLRILWETNNFLKHYHLSKNLSEEDLNIIPFRVFESQEDECFATYLNDCVIPKLDPLMTDEQKKVLKLCLHEIFQNINIHAGGSDIFVCGQYFPEDKNVTFTLADLGKTIGENVRSRYFDEITDLDAILWATEYGNTTKVDESGGLGLDLLRKFMKEKGEIQILSGKGFWLENSLEKDTYQRTMKQYYQGTIVTIQTQINGLKYEENNTEIIF